MRSQPHTYCAFVSLTVALKFLTIYFQYIGDPVCFLGVKMKFDSMSFFFGLWEHMSQSLDVVLWESLIGRHALISWGKATLWMKQDIPRGNHNTLQPDLLQSRLEPNAVRPDKCTLSLSLHFCLFLTPLLSLSLCFLGLMNAERINKSIPLLDTW